MILRGIPNATKLYLRRYGQKVNDTVRLSYSDIKRKRGGRKEKPENAGREQ